MSADLTARAALFRALSHPARLSLLRLCWTDALSGEHLARLMNLAPATVSHHLSQLTEAGLMNMRQDGHHRYFSASRAALEVTLAALVRGQTGVPQAADPYRERVLRSFIRGGKLVQIPAQRKKKDIILHYLAELFEPGQHYPEREVNALLGEYHPDFFTLRRELIGGGLLQRDAGVYWRTPLPQPQTDPPPGPQPEPQPNPSGSRVDS